MHGRRVFGCGRYPFSPGDRSRADLDLIASAVLHRLDKDNRPDVFDARAVDTEATGVGRRVKVSRLALPVGKKQVSFQDIGQALGVSRQRAQQLHKAKAIYWRVEAGVLIVTCRRST